MIYNVNQLMLLKGNFKIILYNIYYFGVEDILTGTGIIYNE